MIPPAEVILHLLLGMVYFWIWIRSGFWLPGYVHYLALLGLVVGLVLVTLIPANAPVMQAGILGQASVVLLCPAIVYFFFILHGGQHAAWERQQEESTDQPPEATALQSEAESRRRE